MEENIRQQEKNKNENEEIMDMGQVTLEQGESRHKIHLLSIIGEIEGHETLSPNAKTTKYEHVLPKLASIEDDDSVDGVLLLLNTVGGDVESGLAIAEMISPWCWEAAIRLACPSQFLQIILILCLRGRWSSIPCG